VLPAQGTVGIAVGASGGGSLFAGRTIMAMSETAYNANNDVRNGGDDYDGGNNSLHFSCSNQQIH